MKTYNVELIGVQEIKVEASDESEAAQRAREMFDPYDFELVEVVPYNYHGLENLCDEHRMDAPKRGAICPVSSKCLSNN